MIEAAQRFAGEILRAPFASRLGLEIGEIGADGATASLAPSESLANAQGFVHGGVAASLSIWSALVATVASDRERAVFASPVSASISYLAPARRETLSASARVASRGRELAHIEVGVTGDGGKPVALALLVVRSVDAMPPVTAPEVATPESLPPDVPDARSRAMISRFSQEMGMFARRADGDSAEMTMFAGANIGAGGAVDPGALVAMSDTCAAVTCLPSIDERRLGSATLSLSAVFGAPLCESPRAVGRRVASDGAIMSALIEIGPAGGALEARPALTACVAYRFLAASARG